MAIPVASIINLVMQLLAISPEVFKRVQELTAGKDEITQADVEALYITKDPEDYRA